MQQNDANVALRPIAVGGECSEIVIEGNR